MGVIAKLAGWLVKLAGNPVTEAQSIGSELVRTLVERSNFADLHPFQAYSLLYHDEPDIGGAIDRLSTLVAQSYRGVSLRDFTGSSAETQCLELANNISQSLHFPALIEQWTEGLLTYGNVFIRKDDFYVLPTEHITLRPRSLPSLTETITEAELLYLNEGDTTREQKFKYTDVYHLKFKDTPIFFTDILGRQTYGLYSPSPLSRLLLTTWWKRQTMIIDVLWRWRMVPHEHHKISSSLFDISRYSGTIEERRQKATQDAETTIRNYITKLKTQAPDQGYVTTDNIDIGVVESKTKFMESNELLAQLDEKVWQALNLPESTVSGRARGSYASELVSSSFVGIKVSALMAKIEPVLLDILKRRVKTVDKSLPYDRLRLEYGFELEAAKIEKFRAASIMASLGAFTLEEIRARAGYPAEVSGELFKIPTTRPPGSKAPGDVLRDVQRGTEPEAETPWSEDEHSVSWRKTKEVER